MLFTDADVAVLQTPVVGLGSRVRLPDGRVGTVVDLSPAQGTSHASWWLLRLPRGIYANYSTDQFELL